MQAKKGLGQKWMVTAAAACMILILSGKPARAGLEQENPGLFEGFVYFAAAAGSHLKAWPMQFPSGLGSHGLAMKILDVLMAGPPDAKLRPAWPLGTSVRAFFLTQDGRAFVDLALEKPNPGHGGLEQTDTLSELLAVYSLVNSLALNIDQVRKVKILINGSDVPSLGGHVSLDHFFKPNMLIVK